MQNRGEAVDIAKQKNMALAGQPKSRHALGNIGNLVILQPLDGKPLPTRSFRAELLANAEKEAADNKKKPMAANIKNNKVVSAKKKVSDKLKISPDSKELKKPESSCSRNKKPQPSLTSVLTARSKAAFGLNNRRSTNIINIDALDINNELAAVEYVDDIYKFYKLVENESKVHDYMHSQPELNGKMRAILIDWLIDVHNKFDLTNETLYLTINIVDRFLASETVSRRELQCVGMSAMLIASKYEEVWAPQVNDFVQISHQVYKHRDVLVMEERILGRLGWNLTVPTPYVFLTRFIKAAVTPPEETTIMEQMVYFYAELGMMHYKMIRYCPSMIAAAAVHAARSTMNKIPAWHETLQLHTGYGEEQVKECSRLLVVFHSVAAKDDKMNLIYSKYSSATRPKLCWRQQ